MSRPHSIFVPTSFQNFFIKNTAILTCLYIPVNYKVTNFIIYLLMKYLKLYDKEVLEIKIHLNNKIFFTCLTSRISKKNFKDKISNLVIESYELFYKHKNSNLSKFFSDEIQVEELSAVVDIHKKAYLKRDELFNIVI